MDLPSRAQEAKTQVHLAAPVSVTFLANKSVNVISVLVSRLAMTGRGQLVPLPHVYLSARELHDK